MEEEFYTTAKIEIKINDISTFCIASKLNECEIELLKKAHNTCGNGDDNDTDGQKLVNIEFCDNPEKYGVQKVSRNEFLEFSTENTFFVEFFC